MSLRAFISLVVVILYSGKLHAQPEVGISELPEWSEQLPLEEFTKDRTGEFQLGVAYLLNDRQVRKTVDGFDYVERTAYRVVDRSGLENSATIAKSFDPESETLSFNFVRILRDGEEIDRLTDAEITLLRQEEGLEASIIDGNVTALIQLEDVRVGDVVDFSYSGSVASRLWPSEFFGAVPVAWSVPLAQSYFKLLVPDNIDVTTKGVSTEIAPEVTVNNGWKSLRLHVIDPDPIPLEQNIPADLAIYGFVIFTTMNSWSDVVDWAIPLFSFEESLPSEFTDKLDEIREAYARPEDRAIQVLRMVQSDIRYLGLEAGLGSHVPRSPRITLERGYGDCKDKAVLLVAALNYLDIDAVPALTSIFGGEMLPQFPPTIGGFDHVIVEIEFDGRKIWVDPTLSHQGGNADNIASLGYGHILPIRAGQSQLVELDISLPVEPIFETVESFEFPETGDVGMRVTVEHIYRSSFADASRIRFSSLGHDSLERSFLDYYAAIYEGATQSTPFSITDDLDANVVVYRSVYEMDMQTYRQSDYADSLPIFGTAVQDILPQQVEARRTAPLALPYGVNARHVVRVSTPGRKFPLPQSKSTSANGISYTLDFQHDGDALEFEYTLIVASEAADLNSIKAVTDLAEEIAGDAELALNMNTAIPAQSRRLGLTELLDRETEEALEAVSTELAQREFVRALASLNALTSEHAEATPLRGVLQILKGTALTLLGRYKAAIEPFEEGFSLHEPPAAEAYYFYLDALTREGENERAAQLVIRLLEQHPDATESMNIDWFLGFLRHLHGSGMESESDSLILAMARTVHEYQPKNRDDFGWVFTDAVEILNSAGNVSGATQYLPYIVSPSVLARLLSSKETEALWEAIEQQAGADLSEAIAQHVLITRSLAAEAPDDFEKQTRHLSALRRAGRTREALDFAEPIAANWPQIEAVGDDAYWFINEYAYALSDAGYPEEAHAIMTRLISLGISENRQLISMAINRAAMLMHWENFEAALEAVDELEALGDGFASDYGRMWIYNVQACSLYQLDRIEESESILRDSILPIADKNASAYTKTMLCLNEPDKAAEIIIDRLHNEETRQNAISSFINALNHDSEPPFLAKLQERAIAVRERPDVRRELENFGRAINMNGTSTYWGTF